MHALAFDQEIIKAYIGQTTTPNEKKVRLHPPKLFLVLQMPNQIIVKEVGVDYSLKTIQTGEFNPFRVGLVRSHFSELNKDEKDGLHFLSLNYTSH
jgi:hypothetical protein